MIEARLHAGAVRELFIEHLGWDHARGVETIEFDGATLQLDRVAQKRGCLVLQHVSDRARTQTKRYVRQLQARISRIAHEHILIVMDHRCEVHVWAWVYCDRERGGFKHRLHPYFTDRIPPAVVTRLKRLSISLEEEEAITLTDVTHRVRQAFDGESDQDIFFRRPGYAVRSHELALRMRAGGSAEFRDFVAFHRKLAGWVAYRYRHLVDDLEDLAQVGAIGLIRAAQRFDPDQGTAFSTYAVPAIRNECVRVLPRNLPLGRIPDYLYWPYRRVLRAWEKAECRGGPHRALDARDHAIEHEGLDETTAVDVHRAFHAESLELHRRRHWIERIGTVDYSNSTSVTGQVRHPLNELARVDLSRVVSRSIETLDPVDQKIVRARYGVGCEEETLKSIGNRLGYTRERIRQREVNALEALRLQLIRVYGSDLIPRGKARSTGMQSEEEVEDV